MIPTLLEIPLPFGWGSIPIHSFGLMMVLAFLAAWRRLELCLKEGGEDPALAERMVTWAAIGGIIGARLLFVVGYPNDFAADPLGTLFGGAGFVFYGGFIGGVFAVWLLLRKVGRPFWPMSDLVAPSLAIGYAVGRIGCQLSGDGDYGMASDLPWAMSYSLGVVPTPPGLRVHPAPLYETVGALAIAYILLRVRRARQLPQPGQIFGLYLLLSACARFLVEWVRIEPVIALGLTQAQLVALALCCCGAAIIGIPRKAAR
ncbi:MAG: prolipoprotein diacylglyceryl transferase [Bdellovibrionales bacterium]|nr:prolipoprotein diacylglyceryl transferase [Bdellovibrionales bacterium]